ncbi:MAG: hypothetical protein QNL62_19625 [Gammaproteobacteria bacterium]|nr:hypothetical protein [Gammaproteobacteria bacterium]
MKNIPVVTSAVYHLIKNDKVFYVGASTGVLSCLSSWVTNKNISIDDIEVFPCEPKELAEKELEHIKRYKPKYNKAGLVYCYSAIALKPKNSYQYAIKILQDNFGSFVQSNALIKAVLAKKAVELLIICSEIGFPEPCKMGRGSGVRGKWLKSDVIQWLQKSINERPEANV